jgi:hypothetical protein
VRIDDELSCRTSIEVSVALRCLIQRYYGCVDGFGDMNAGGNADCIRNGEAAGISPVTEMVHAVTPGK